LPLVLHTVERLKNESTSTQTRLLSILQHIIKSDLIRLQSFETLG